MMYQILKKTYKKYLLVEEFDNLEDAKDTMEGMKLLYSHLKFNIKNSIQTQSLEYFSVNSKPRAYFKMVEKL